MLSKPISPPTQPAAPARRGRKPVKARAIGFVALVCLSLVAVEGWRSWVARGHEMQLAEKTSANLARALAQHAQDTIKAADSVLVSVVERLETDGLHANSERMRRLLMKHVAELPQLQGLLVFDEHGNWVVNALEAPPQVMNNADREYFIYHRTHAERGPNIGVPLVSRSKGRLMVPVSRRIEHPDGSFAGVALATIEMSYLQKFYEGFDIGQAGVIFPALDNGVYLARRPFVEALIGKSLKASRLFREFLPRGPVGTAKVVAVADGVERLYAYRRLQSYPMVAFAGLSTDEIYARWLSQTYQHIAVTALATLTWAGWACAWSGRSSCAPRPRPS